MAQIAADHVPEIIRTDDSVTPESIPQTTPEGTDDIDSHIELSNITNTINNNSLVSVGENEITQNSNDNPTINVRTDAGNEDITPPSLPNISESKADTDSRTITEASDSEVKILDAKSTTNDNLSSKVTPSVCKICGNNATLAKKKNERNVLACHECGHLVHFHCTRAPSYILYTYSTTGKRFICETCVKLPDAYSQSTSTTTVTPNITTPVTDDARMDKIEGKVDLIMDLLQKYNIPSIADVVQTAMERIEKLPQQQPEIVVNNASDQKWEKKVEVLEEEVRALHSSERLLLDSIREKDSEIST